MKRRQAITTLAAAAAAMTLPSPLLALQPRLRFGYAAITWGGNDRQAIADIASIGFRGIQLRTAAVEAFGDRPAALADLLAAHSLTMVALSSGNIGIDPALEADEMSRHVRHARFVRDVGGLYLQIIDSRPTRAVTVADYAAMGRRLTELGKRTADIGIPLGYHHHMGSLGEGPDEIERIMSAVDTRYVRLQLDTAHYLQGGGDPIAAVRKYGSAILFVHLKDVESRTPDPVQNQGRPYRFVELGRGRVDLPGVVRALDEVGFKGWIVIELDAVPDRARTPKESAEINRRYITDRLGLVI